MDWPSIMGWPLILGAAVVCVVLIIVRQHYAGRDTYRPLAHRQPQNRAAQAPELGMEALDMSGVRRTHRRNDSLERVNNIWTRRGSATHAIDTSVDALADDETYARRFHAAFMKNKD